MNLFSLDPDTPVSQRQMATHIPHCFLFLKSSQVVQASLKFSLWPQVLRSPRAEHSADGASVRPFEEKLGRRFMITCRSLKLMLQGCINESETDPVTNVSSQKTADTPPSPPANPLSPICLPDRAVLRVAVAAGRTRRQEGVGRLPRGPEPRGSASDAVRQRQRRGCPGARRRGERPKFPRREEAGRLLPQRGHGSLAVFPQTGKTGCASSVWLMGIKVSLLSGTVVAKYM